MVIAERNFRERRTQCRIDVALRLESRRFWVVAQDRPVKLRDLGLCRGVCVEDAGSIGLPRVGEAQASSGDEIAIVDVILGQTIWGT